MAAEDRKSRFPLRNSLIGALPGIAAIVLGLVLGAFVIGRRAARLAEESPEQSGLAGITSVAVGPDFDLYVGGSFGVKRLDAGMQPLAEWRTKAPVTALAVDEHGNIYAARGLPDRQTGGGLVEKFSPDGESLVTWGRGGCPGDPFKVVTGLAAARGNLFVADAGAKLVYRFDYDGRPLGEIGSKESDPDGTGFLVPSPHFDCAVRDGVLYVTNPGRHRVETFDFDGNRLGLWGEFGNAEHQFPGCCNPTNITLASDGYVIVSQKGRPVVKVFTRDGKYIATLGEGPFPADARGIDLAVTHRGVILAVDPVAGELRTFTLGAVRKGETR